MKLRPRFRLRRWRYTRQLLAMGCAPERARPMATIAASLHVPPKVIWSPSSERLNHWSAWSVRPSEAPYCPDAATVDRIGGWDTHAIWLDEAPLAPPADGG